MKNQNDRNGKALKPGDTVRLTRSTRILRENRGIMATYTGPSTEIPSMLGLKTRGGRILTSPRTYVEKIEVDREGRITKIGKIDLHPESPAAARIKASPRWDGETPPRIIEALIRLTHRTLDHMSAKEFDLQVWAAGEAYKGQEETCEKLARSMGL